MGDWFEGLPTVVGLAAASVVAGALALLLVRSLRLERRLLRRVTQDSGSPTATIEQLVTLADLARAQGLLVAESRVDPAAEPLLALGLKLAADGVPADQMAEQLNQSLDARTLGSPVNRLLTDALGRWPSLLVAAGASILLMVLLSQARDPAAAPRFIVAAAAFIFLGAACANAVLPITSVDQASGPARLLCGVFQVLGATMIRSGSSGHAIRERLTGMLPPSSRPSIRVADAA